MEWRRKCDPQTQEVLPMEFAPRSSTLNAEGRSRHYLTPGAVFTSATACAVTTILGSSVSLCLWDSVNKIGGANHFLLPGDNSDESSPRTAKVANEILLRELIKLGASIKGLQGKIFGGAHPTVTFGSAPCVGNRNVETVERFLKMHGIRLIASEVGGIRGRKLVFHTDTGESWAAQL